MSGRIIGMTDRGKVWEFPEDTTHVEVVDQDIMVAHSADGTSELIEPATAITIELDIPPGAEIGEITTYYGGPA